MRTTTRPVSTEETPQPRRADESHCAQWRGGAMGSSAHIVATGEAEVATPLIAWAAGRIDELEARWSRFISTSEVSVLNDCPGIPVAVTTDTLTLVTRALEARVLSGGRFDPTMLQAMKANGYDRTFVSIKTPAGLPALATRRIGLGQISIDHDAHTVTLSASTGFDPGGIGKGLAADIVAEEMIERGAFGALVNIGGDVRCIGEGPADGAWVIAIGDDVAGVDNRVVEMSEGGIASSTRRHRQWTRLSRSGPVEAHHLLDPATGRPSEVAAHLVTVIAARCADAEWLATAIASEGALPSDPSIVGNATVLLTDHDGNSSVAGNPEVFLR